MIRWKIDLKSSEFNEILKEHDLVLEDLLTDAGNDAELKILIRLLSF